MKEILQNLRCFYEEKLLSDTLKKRDFNDKKVSKYVHLKDTFLVLKKVEKSCHERNIELQETINVKKITGNSGAYKRIL